MSLRRVGDQMCMKVPLCSLVNVFCSGSRQEKALCQALQHSCPRQSFESDPSWPCTESSIDDYAPYRENLYDESLLGNGMFGGFGGLGLSPFKT